MKTIVLIISNLFLITAAPVDQHHDIEARSASEENENAELQTLLTEVRDTLANVNKPPVADPPITRLQQQEPSPPVQMAYILNPLSPMSPPADAKPAQQASVPQINLFISGPPQQDRLTAAEPPKQSPLQQLVLANPEPIPAIQRHPQVVALPPPYGSILPQNAVVMPFGIPSQMYPNMIGPLQSSAFLGPQFNPYLQPVNPLGPQGFGPQGFGPYPFNPQMYNPNPYNHGMPNVAISPPIIFRERGPTVTAQG